MEFKRENPAARFTVPDRPTVRQQLEYIGLSAGVSSVDMILRQWQGAQALIQEWECEVLPYRDVDLDDLTDPTQTSVIIWASLAVRDHINKLEDIPKNS